MISVCNKQDLNSTIAESIERNGQPLINILQSMGTKSGEFVKFSIQRDSNEILGSYEFAMPDKSPLTNNNQQPINMEDMIKTCLRSWEEKYGFLSELSKSEPSTDGTTKTLYKCTFDIGSFQFSDPSVKCPRLQITIPVRSCCFPCDIC